VAESGFEKATIIFNHMRSGEPEESRAYVEVMDGANCESWMSLRTALNGEWGWKAKVRQVRDVNRLGKLTNLLCVPSHLSEDEAKFCFASYLFAMDGDQAYFFYGTNYKISGQQNAWYSSYDLDIGEPMGDREQRDGGFLRVFSKGAVVVNPTASSVTITLPRAYVTPARQPVKQVTLEPNGAELLRTAHEE
jgi:hypothetical protein